MKLIVAGGREFKDYQLMIKHLHFYVEYHRSKKGIVIIHGAQRGADLMAHQYAVDWGVPVDPNPYDKRLGKKGPPARNRIMAAKGDELLAFWDGESPGTRHMIDCMAKLRKPFKVVYY